MFLYYVVARDVQKVDELLASETLQSRLGLRYNRTTISVLDLYAAQLQHETLHSGVAPILPPSLDTLKDWFAPFELWFNTIKQAKLPRIATNSSTKIALFVGAAAQVWGTPAKITTDNQWELIQILLTQGPGAIERDIGHPYQLPRESGLAKRNQFSLRVRYVSRSQESRRGPPVHKVQFLVTRLSTELEGCLVSTHGRS